MFVMFEEKKLNVVVVVRVKRRVRGGVRRLTGYFFMLGVVGGFKDLVFIERNGKVLNKGGV